MKSSISPETLERILRVNPNEPSQIITRESATIEFKESYNPENMTKYFKIIASFANNNGGYIFFGVGDKPRRLLGLNDKSLQQFKDLNVETLTEKLLEYFSPEIKYERTIYKFNGKSLGVIYIYPLKSKPCICTKNSTAKDNKPLLRTSDIYYRYNGRSERIRYTELAYIIDEARRKEERRWTEFLKKVANVGVSNVALLNLKTDKLAGSDVSFVLDKDLLKKIAFIQKGKFAETNGTPTLRLSGDIQKISSEKIVVKEINKEVIRAINPNDIIRSFLNNKVVDSPLEYVKRICSATSANYPLYFFIRQAKVDIPAALALVQKTTSRSITKKRLIDRLKGKYIEQVKIPVSKTPSAIKKAEYQKFWLSENMPNEIKDINYCVGSIFYLSKKEIFNHQKYIRSIILKIFENSYEQASSNIASEIRKAICRIDEALYFMSS